MIEDFKDVIKHYGYRNQLKKLSEEVYELQEAVLDYENQYGKLEHDDQYYKLLEHIEEEIADVKHLLYQITFAYDLDTNKITEIMIEKNKRQHRRMEQEKGRNNDNRI